MCAFFNAFSYSDRVVGGTGGSASCGRGGDIGGATRSGNQGASGSGDRGAGSSSGRQQMNTE